MFIFALLSHHSLGGSRSRWWGCLYTDLEGSIVVKKVIEGKNDFGFNAETGQYEELLKSGIIDPTKVARFALQDAASVAGLLLTTEAMVAEKPEKKKPPMHTMPPEDMY